MLWGELWTWRKGKRVEAPWAAFLGGNGSWVIPGKTSPRPSPDTSWTDFPLSAWSLKIKVSLSQKHPQSRLRCHRGSSLQSGTPRRVLQRSWKMLPSGASRVAAARGAGWRAKGFRSHWQTWGIWETSLPLELLCPLWLCNHGSHGSWVAGVTFSSWRNRSLLIHKYLCALLRERSYWRQRWERHGLVALGEHYWQGKRLCLSVSWKLCYRVLEPTPTPTPTPPHPCHCSRALVGPHAIPFCGLWPCEHQRGCWKAAFILHWQAARTGG